MLDKTTLSQSLEAKGIRASYQRLRIYQELTRSSLHPRAEDLYQFLVKEIPSLSRTTVYNTLNLLVEKSLAKMVTIENNEVRYDAWLEDHGHFKCEKCGKVSDFTVNVDFSTSKELSGYDILEKDVYVKGICANCQY